ncbi:uncharacterized protein LOC122397195 isoform X2 [Colletes gigas]|uniref:uncharacterized protein LOC122397195 isoform X2 n=1 Tax=Colletes gigas TaxID=935657 RepID=UPI001C9AED80|nr:uncharacterized protein LOC122397195 isoform X2 [Colletes gigas]
MPAIPTTPLGAKEVRRHYCRHRYTQLCQFWPYCVADCIYANILPVNHHESIPARMSGKLRKTSLQWDSSSEEDDAYECKYNMRLRDSLRNTQQSQVSESETASEPRKRGRGPSKRPCLNRNALMARENRLKKKAYLEKVESKLSYYQQENKKLVNFIRKQGVDIKRLTGEVAYLRSVLNNNTTITALLKTINNGFRKISTQKTNSFYPHVSQCPPKSEIEQKCKCNMIAKENILNNQNGNTFATSINCDSLNEHIILESQSSEPCTNTKNQIISNIKDNLKKKETVNTITSITSPLSEDSYMNGTKELDGLLPFTQTDLSNIKKNTDAIGIDFDQLSSFNMDIFEDLPKCEEMMDTVENLNDTSNLFTEEEISQSLDNTGICLHVNSDKVSLEFCSICHMNSKNLVSN